MAEELKEYCLLLINGIPSNICILALVTFFVGGALLCCITDIKRACRYSAALLLLELVFLLYGATVYFRGTLPKRLYNFTPFWSYQKIADGDSTGLLSENIMNVVSFVPIGFLLGFVSKRLKWWMIIMVGFSLSLSVEVLQFVSKRGFTEFDDIIHNTIGCLLGLVLLTFMTKIWNILRDC